MKSKTYKLIIDSIRSNRLKEPFSEKDFRNSCPNLPEGTYRAFLHKHSKGNPGGHSELFERISPGFFICIRPYKYNF